MSFKFTPERMKKVEEILTHYPSDRKQAALLMVLWEVQYQPMVLKDCYGFLSYYLLA